MKNEVWAYPLLIQNIRQNHYKCLETVMRENGAYAR